MKQAGWRGRLEDYVGKTVREPFAYGHNDCALWVAGAVLEMTGEDPASELRGKYSTLTGGLKQIQKTGRMDHIDVVSELFEEVEPSLACVGDIAAVPGEEMLSLGIVGGSHIHVLMQSGLGIVPLTKAVRVWRV